MQRFFLGKRRAEANDEAPVWSVVRLGAKDKATRTSQGGDLRSPQSKTSCHSLTVGANGVRGTVKGWFFDTSIEDYNNYRSQGHEGRFEAGTGDRAVSVGTVAAYTVLQEALQQEGGGKPLVQLGDLGENILINGPPARATDVGGLSVGDRIQVGTVTLELTEANNPCYRFNAHAWAPAAQKLWGATAPEGNPLKWFKSPHCPLNHEVNPGIRGWLAKVVQEGEITIEDTAKIVVVEDNKEEGTDSSTDTTSNTSTSLSGDSSPGPSPTKKRKTDG